jgi:hypothetical protein
MRWRLIKDEAAWYNGQWTFNFPRFSKKQSKVKTMKHALRELAEKITWWGKEKSFYVVHKDSTLAEDEESIDGFLFTNDFGKNAKSPKPRVLAEIFPAAAVSFRRSKRRCSFQSSIESIDSLLESCWDPEDDSSQCTEVVSNSRVQPDFFIEHLDFLSIQTQPRQVQLVYRK